MFLKISQISQKNFWELESLFLIQLQSLRPATLLERDCSTDVFSVKFAKFLRTAFFTEHLLLNPGSGLLFGKSFGLFLVKTLFSLDIMAILKPTSLNSSLNFDSLFEVHGNS